MDLGAVEKQFDEWEKQYAQWAEPINRFIRENIARVNKGGYTVTAFKQGLDAVRAERLSEFNPFAEFRPFFDRLCSDYSSASAERRDALRSAVARRPTLGNALINYAHRCAEAVRAAKDVESLRRGLAAISIDDCGADGRDSLIALAELYVGAEEQGLDPEPHVQEVAAISGTVVPRGWVTPVSQILGGLRASAIVSERRARGRPYFPR
ncbi:MAG: hypothetical protein HYR85_05300 [Planctomycetes bacterium]|nr:hypothetical protein [Planctomycetota bacterium]MBI3846152.1 hypothetical protein [Planctomycetota bacterium]